MADNDRDQALARIASELFSIDPTLASLVNNLRMTSGVLHGVVVAGDEPGGLNGTVIIGGGYTLVSVVLSALFLLNQAKEVVSSLRESHVDMNLGTSAEYDAMVEALSSSVQTLESAFSLSFETNEVIRN